MTYSKAQQTRSKPKRPRQRKCLSCREWFQPEIPEEEWMKPATTCSTDCAIAYGRSQFKSQKKKEQRREKQKLRDQDRRALLKDCKDIANSIGKLKRFVKGQVYCVTCGATDCKFDGGHYKHASTHSAVRFNIKNINPQCVNCNQYNGGREAVYRKWMVKEYGEEFTQWIDDQRQPHKYTLQYLHKFKRIMGKKKRRLENKFKEMQSCK